MADVDTQQSFLRQKHARYLAMCLKALPQKMASIDTQRMTILYFAVAGLDLLNSLDLIASKKKAIIDWIYAQQVLPTEDNANVASCGFRGGSFTGSKFDPSTHPSCSSCLRYDYGHVTMSYTALSTLVILGDDLSRVNRKAVITALRHLQTEEGGIYATIDKSENDVRFLYCACVVSHLLGDWSGIDVEKAVAYIKARRSYDSAFSAAPGLESHAGYTFLCIASLHLMGKLESTYSKKELSNIVHWCVMRQLSGFNGRAGKPADTCYSFWVGGTLQILNAYDLFDHSCQRSFLLTTQSTSTGGLAKSPDVLADPLHTFLGLCGFSLSGEPDVQPLNPALNMSQRAADFANSLNKK